MKTHKDLKVWQNSIAMVTEIYKITGSFLQEKLYGSVDQMRRCAASIPSNIAKESAMNSENEFIRYLYISLGRCTELDPQLRIARNLHFLSENSFQGIMEQNSSIRKNVSRTN